MKFWTDPEGFFVLWHYLERRSAHRPNGCFFVLLHMANLIDNLPLNLHKSVASMAKLVRRHTSNVEIISSTLIGSSSFFTFFTTLKYHVDARGGSPSSHSTRATSLLPCSFLKQEACGMWNALLCDRDTRFYNSHGISAFRYCKKRKNFPSQIPSHRSNERKT